MPPRNSVMVYLLLYIWHQKGELKAVVATTHRKTLSIECASQSHSIEKSRKKEQVPSVIWALIAKGKSLTVFTDEQ